MDNRGAYPLWEFNEIMHINILTAACYIRSTKYILTIKEKMTTISVDYTVAKSGRVDGQEVYN